MPQVIQYERWRMVSVVHACAGDGHQGRSLWWLPDSPMISMVVSEMLSWLPCRTCFPKTHALEIARAIEARHRRELFGPEMPPNVAPGARPRPGGRTPRERFDAEISRRAGLIRPGGNPPAA